MVGAGHAFALLPDTRIEFTAVKASSKKSFSKSAVPGCCGNSPFRSGAVRIECDEIRLHSEFGDDRVRHSDDIGQLCGNGRHFLEDAVLKAEKRRIL